jgi:hypothetical protein
VWICSTCFGANYSGYAPWEGNLDTELRICQTCQRPRGETPCVNTEHLVPVSTSEELDADLTEAEKEVGRVNAGPSGLTPKMQVLRHDGSVVGEEDVFRGVWGHHAELSTPNENGSSSHLYLETGKAPRIYQYPTPPSPGDLHRIRAKELRVFHVKDGTFQEIDGSGNMFCVDKYEFLPKAPLNEPTKR